MLNALIIIMVFATIVYEVSEILVYELDLSIRWLRVEQVCAYVNAMIFIAMPLFYKGKKVVLLFTLVGLYWLWKSWNSRARYIYNKSIEESNKNEEKENKHENKEE